MTRTSQQQRKASPKEDEAAQFQFTGTIFARTEDTWQQLFQQMENKVESLCAGDVPQPAAARRRWGVIRPRRQQIYIDLFFYNEMKNKLGAGGEFAQGYVIAHEFSHHVQHLLGIEQKVCQMQQGASQIQVNQLSVKMELQADCFAGVWGHYMQQQNILETGNLESALNAAKAIGDDRLCSAVRGAWCRTTLPTALHSRAIPSLEKASTAEILASVIPLSDKRG